MMIVPEMILDKTSLRQVGYVEFMGHHDAIFFDLKSKNYVMEPELVKYDKDNRYFKYLFELWNVPEKHFKEIKPIIDFWEDLCKHLDRDERAKNPNSN